MEVWKDESEVGRLAGSGWCTGIPLVILPFGNLLVGILLFSGTLARKE